MWEYLTPAERWTLRHDGDVTIIVPAYNEETGIRLTLSELMTEFTDSTLLVIDGRSSDNTVEVALNMGVKVIAQEGSEGKGQAMAQSLSHVGDGSRYVVFTDADYTYPAKYISKMLDVLDKDPTVGMVTGNRFSNASEYEKASSNTFYIGNRLLAFSHSLLNGVNMRDPFTGLRVIRSTLLGGWKPKSKGFDIEAELNNYVLKRGYRIVEIPISYRPRVGQKKLRVRHGITILQRILRESLPQD